MDNAFPTTLSVSNPQDMAELTINVISSLFIPIPAQMDISEFSKDPKDFHGFVRRMCTKLSSLSASTFVTSLIYLSRLRRCFPTLPISTLNASRLWVICLSLGAKFVEDSSFKADDWCVTTGCFLTPKKLADAERELCGLLGYSFFVSPDGLNKFLVAANTLSQNKTKRASFTR